MNNFNQQNPNELLKQRQPDRYAKMIVKENADVVFLLAPSDWGTVLNNGRRGSLFGPKVITNLISKMAAHPKKNYTLEIHEVTNIDDEQASTLEDSQKNEQQKILSALRRQPSLQHILHIGGGHDHFHPLILGVLELLKTPKKILIINIDPHLDTRTDNWANSGTPFRNLDHSLSSKKLAEHTVHLVQIGTHLFANGESNLSELKNLQQKIYYMNDVKKHSSFIDFVQVNFEKMLNEYDEIVLSIDIDAIKSSEMPAVSAPNHNGFSMEEMHEFVHYLKQTVKHKFKVTGLYEYNPMFDDLANSSGRQIAALIYQQFLTKTE